MPRVVSPQLLNCYVHLSYIFPVFIYYVSDESIILPTSSNFIFQEICNLYNEHNIPISKTLVANFFLIKNM